MERGNSTSAVSVRRICDFPDSILSHVLSFLPTKNAVATSVLSHRWKFMWSMTNNLDFECPPYNEIDRFVEFVDYVLRLHNPGFLNGFTLEWRTGRLPIYVNAWISTAIARNVRKLNLCARISEFPIDVQRSMFTCESLQSLVLKVNYPFCISRELVFFLPKLETLELDFVVFESEETLCKLLRGCPVLKHLLLHIDIVKTTENCHLDNRTMFRCMISSASLRRLVLFADDPRRCNCYMAAVQLDAPLLKYVELDRISSISVRQIPIFLVEANIQLKQPDFKEQDHYNSVVEAFHAFDGAQKLVLNHGVIKAFKKATIEMKSVFNKLTRLEVTKDFIYWYELHHFLQFSDNLEVLILREETDDWYDGTGVEEANFIAAEPNLVPRCLSNSLRLFSIDGYNGNEDGFAVISYILQHARFLQLMKFHGWLVAENEIEVIQKLPRKSHVCEVEFSGWSQRSCASVPGIPLQQ